MLVQFVLNIDQNEAKQLPFYPFFAHVHLKLLGSCHDVLETIYKSKSVLDPSSVYSRTLSAIAAIRDMVVIVNVFI